MVTKIIAVSDLHIRKLIGLDEAKEQLGKFIEECKRVVAENGVESTRIVIAGDLLHSKLSTSGEMYQVLFWFLSGLNDVCQTIIIAGNHDLNMSNLDRVDSITPVFDMCDFKNVKYLDRELGYKSGPYVDDNIVWCLYSTFDNFNGPNDMKVLKSKYSDKTFVGLFHGDLNGAKNAAGAALTGLEPKHFAGTDFVIAGHIHKTQEISKKDIKIVYCGSLIQQNFGEDVSGHGYITWDVEDKTWALTEIPNENRGYFKFKIESENDIEEGKEVLANC